MLGDNFWFSENFFKKNKFFIYFFIQTHTGFNYLFSPYLAKLEAEGRAINKYFKFYCDNEHEL